MHIRYQGFKLHRLWPRSKNQPAGWLVRLGNEPMLLSKQESGWQIEPCEQPFRYDLSGRVMAAPLDPDFHQLAMLIRYQVYPSRYQALQAAKGLIFEQGL